MDILLKSLTSAHVTDALRRERVWLVSAVFLGVLLLFDPAQAANSVGFIAANLIHVAPYLLLSISIAAYASASGADGLIARAFTGSPLVMIAVAALAGGLSPFCSCGVIPLIAALLVMGVPLPAVMAFWLASPVMDPSMFILTSGLLGVEFALAKTLAALGLGFFGGLATHIVVAAGGLHDDIAHDKAPPSFCPAEAGTAMSQSSPGIKGNP